MFRWGRDEHRAVGCRPGRTERRGQGSPRRACSCRRNLQRSVPDPGVAGARCRSTGVRPGVPPATCAPGERRPRRPPGARHRTRSSTMSDPHPRCTAGRPDRGAPAPRTRRDRSRPARAARPAPTGHSRLARAGPRRRGTSVAERDGPGRDRRACVPTDVPAPSAPRGTRTSPTPTRRSPPARPLLRGRSDRAPAPQVPATRRATPVRPPTTRPRRARHRAPHDAALEVRRRARRTVHAGSTTSCGSSTLPGAPSGAPTRSAFSSARSTDTR